MTAALNTSAGRRVVVVSPHLDDAVLSLGAMIAGLTQSRPDVTVLTVFAGDPSSTKEASDWDARGGFRTEGEAASARRVEDAAGCRVLGAEPVWLSFPDGPYAQSRDEEEIWAAVCSRVGAADTLLLPGFPLTNSDHRWLAELLLRRDLPCESVGIYAEQPYRYWVRRSRPDPDFSGLPSLDGVRWNGSARATIRHLARKWRALRAYSSQLPLLGLQAHDGRLLRLLGHEAAHGGEMLAWIRRT